MERTPCSPNPSASVIKEQAAHLSSESTLSCTVTIDWSSVRTSKYDYVREYRDATSNVLWVINRSDGSKFGAVSYAL
jgi:hypothetical protein